MNSNDWQELALRYQDELDSAIDVIKVLSMNLDALENQNAVLRKKLREGDADEQ